MLLVNTTTSSLRALAQHGSYTVRVKGKRFTVIDIDTDVEHFQMFALDDGTDDEYSDSEGDDVYISPSSSDEEETEEDEY